MLNSSKINSYNCTPFAKAVGWTRKHPYAVGLAYLAVAAIFLSIALNSSAFPTETRSIVGFSFLGLHVPIGILGVFFRKEIQRQKAHEKSIHEQSAQVEREQSQCGLKKLNEEREACSCALRKEARATIKETVFHKLNISDKTPTILLPSRGVTRSSAEIGKAAIYDLRFLPSELTAPVSKGITPHPDPSIREDVPFVVVACQEKRNPANIIVFTLYPTLFVRDPKSEGGCRWQCISESSEINDFFTSSSQGCLVADKGDLTEGKLKVFEKLLHYAHPKYRLASFKDGAIQT